MAYLKQAKTEDEIKKLTVANVKKAYNELARDYNKIIEENKPKVLGAVNVIDYFENLKGNKVYIHKLDFEMIITGRTPSSSATL